MERIFFIGEGDKSSINQMPCNLAKSYPEFDNFNELNFGFAKSQIITDDVFQEKVQLYEFAYLWEGEWLGNKNDFLDIINHPESLCSNTIISGAHCEVFTNGKWYGGNEHEELERKTIS